MLIQPTQNEMISRTGRVVALVATLILAIPTSGQAQTTYDLSQFPFQHYYNSTDVVATLTASTTGTFTTEEEIEDFMNSATWSVALLDGSETVVELTELNSSWNLGLYGDSSAILTVTETEITLDFGTPYVDGSSAELRLFDPVTGYRMSILQRNDWKEGNYVSIDRNAGGERAESGYNYNTPFVFPAQSATGAELSFNKVTGGITTDGGRIQYSGSPTGWTNNRVESLDIFPYFGYVDNFEVRFSIESDPSNSLWVVGLGSSSLARWQSMNQTIRNDNGRMMVFETGIWRTTGPVLSEGDVVSILAKGDIVEYRHNDDVVYTSSISASWDSSVTANFKYGAATVNASIRMGGVPQPPTGITVPITAWVNPTGIVTTSENTVIFPGTVSPGWFNSVNSIPLSALSAGDDYEVSWTVDDSPTNSIWVAGLGVTETRSNWRDVDFAFRNSKGFITIHESGVFIKDVGSVAVGDVLSLHVNGSQLDFKFNGTVVYSRPSSGADDFYIDTSFKSGAARLSFSLTVGGSPPLPPPPGSFPITNWVGEVGGVSTSGDSISYSGSPTGWNNSVNSASLSSLGAYAEYKVSWTVDSDPVNSLWVVGFGSTESGSSWRDVDVGVRNANGWLLVYVGDQYHGNLGQISVGDVVEMKVLRNGGNGCISFGINRTGMIISCPYLVDWDMDKFYIDTAFKNGAADLSGFTITND